LVEWKIIREKKLSLTKQANMGLLPTIAGKLLTALMVVRIDIDD
jgi:hypothetical protein